MLEKDGARHKIKRYDCSNIPDGADNMIQRVIILFAFVLLTVQAAQAGPNEDAAAVRANWEQVYNSGDADKFVAAYPVTIGSAKTASPIGDWKVQRIVKLPRFRYDVAMLNYGRRSGKRYRFPIGYLRQGSTLFCYSPFSWWRNLSSGAPVTVTVRGRALQGRAEVDPSLIVSREVLGEVLAGGEGAAGARQHHHLHRRVLRRIDERGAERFMHGCVERVELVGPLERQRPDA